jgi:hypothetical protein
MACDIHFYVERRVNGTWESCDRWEPDEYYPGRTSCKTSYYPGRNYHLFAILADVRNYQRNLADDRADNRFVPISQPKGLRCAGF